MGIMWCCWSMKQAHMLHEMKWGYWPLTKGSAKGFTQLHVHPLFDVWVESGFHFFHLSQGVLVMSFYDHGDYSPFHIYAELCFWKVCIFGYVGTWCHNAGIQQHIVQVHQQAKLTCASLPLVFLCTPHIFINYHINNYLFESLCSDVPL